jgi:hypothetical protein
MATQNELQALYDLGDRLEKALLGAWRKGETAFARAWKLYRAKGFVYHVPLAVIHIHGLQLIRRRPRTTIDRVPRPHVR